MIGETISIRGHITHHTASEAHGIGADTGVRSGASHGTTDGMTLGSTDGAIHGITEATGADGTTRGITGDTGDGMTHGTMEAIGERTTLGIRTMPDGTEDGIRIGDTAMARDMDTEDISQAIFHTFHATRLRQTTVYLPDRAKPQPEEAWGRAAAPHAEPSEEAAHRAPA